MIKKWFVSQYEDALSSGSEVGAHTADDAAAEWVDWNYSDLDYPSHIHVYVSDGKTESRYLVDVEQTPHFSAKPDPHI